MQGDLILKNGVVRTMDGRGTTAAALAIHGGRIVRVGDDGDVAGIKGEVLDLGGRCVLPGFTDSHAHLVAHSVGLARIDLRTFGSLDAAMAEVGRRASVAGSGDWILGRGWLFRGWGLDSFPTRAMIDAVAPDRPVALTSMDGHVIWVNSQALRIAGIERGTPDPEGGEIERGPGGEPTGILKERAADFLKEKIPLDPPGVLARTTLKGQSALHALGITSVHDLEKKKALRAFTRMKLDGSLKLRVRYFLDEAEVEPASGAGIEAGFGDALLRIVGVKAYADGSLLSETAYMLEGYGKEGGRGIPVSTPGYFDDLIRRAAELRLPITVHAIGDAANRMILDAVEKAGAATVYPYRIEHAQHLDPADLPRFARMGVTVSMQPIHLSFDLDQVDRALGARAPGAYRLRSLLDSGAKLVFGSDIPVADPNPWLGVSAAVNRTRFDGTPAEGWFPAERITVEEAIAAYTRTPPTVVGDEEVLGTLEPGKLADLCVLDRDPFTIPPRELAGVRADLTVFGGEIVHRSDAFA